MLWLAFTDVIFQEYEIRESDNFFAFICQVISINKSNLSVRLDFLLRKIFKPEVWNLRPPPPPKIDHFGKNTKIEFLL